MQVATALRIVSVVVAAKALLIGVVYWRRAEILGRPVHIGAGSWACLIAVVTIGVAIALTGLRPIPTGMLAGVALGASVRTG
jgi:hypothetical protein